MLCEKVDVLTNQLQSSHFAFYLQIAANYHCLLIPTDDIQYTLHPPPLPLQQMSVHIIIPPRSNSAPLIDVHGTKPARLERSVGWLGEPVKYVLNRKTHHKYQHKTAPFTHIKQCVYLRLLGGLGEAHAVHHTAEHLLIVEHLPQCGEIDLLLHRRHRHYLAARALRLLHLGV